MRPIPSAPAPGQRILLIPAMLDAHFPLLQYAFHSRAYYPVILSQSRGLADLGLRYAHNDLCYPFVLSLGQYLQALGSGAYDLDQVSLLMPSAGDACRGSNFPSLIRKALAAAGYPQVEVLTWNVKGLERDHALPLRPEMVWRALFGLFYGDLLLLLTLQTRPYEAVAGAANACRDRWTAQRLPLDPPQDEGSLSPGRRGLCRPAPPAGGQEAGGPGGGALYQILRPGQLGHPPLSGGGGL